MIKQSKPFKDSTFLNTTYQEFTVDNNRKITVSETYHNNKVFINVREFVKSSSLEGNHWIPRNGLFMLPEKMLTFWNDLDKTVRYLIDQNTSNDNKTTQHIV